jgi:hypothetical protein
MGRIKPNANRRKEMTGSREKSLTTNGIKAIRTISNLIANLPLHIVIITGDADGVDEIVRDVCRSVGRDYSVIFSKEDNWKDGYEKRNRIIADYADKIFSVVLPLDKNNPEPCYHCKLIGRDSNHTKTAGCWTGYKNKNYEVVVIQ